MHKITLYFISLTIIIAASTAASFAQPAAPGKVREVKVYWLQYDNNESPTGLVAAKRNVDAAAPLRGAFAELINNSPTYEEERSGQRRFIYGIEDFSVRLKNGTAQIDLSTEYGFEWGEPMRSYFIDAIEKTALQFSEVKKVRICVDGRLDFFRIDRTRGRKC